MVGSPPAPAQGHALHDGHRVFFTEKGHGMGTGAKLLRRRAGSLRVDGLSRPPRGTHANCHRGHQLPGLVQLRLQPQVPPDTQGWSLAAGEVSQPGARNVLLQQGRDSTCHVLAMGEQCSRAPRCGPATAAPNPAPLGDAPRQPRTNRLLSLPVPCPLPRGSPERGGAHGLLPILPVNSREPTASAPHCDPRCYRCQQFR